MPSATDASSLAAEVLAADTPPAAAAAASSAAEYLRSHAGDLPRAFFADAFPSLLFRLFVTSPTWPSFLDLAASDAALADLLVSLLSPSGPLLAAVAVADRLELLRFVFPSERLPDWLRLALSSASDASSTEAVSPLLAGRVGSELHLSVFEYYLFWFAYYPISAAAKSASAPAASSNPTFKSRSRLEGWVSTLAATGTRKPGQKPESSLYLNLLYAYLREFVPNACVPPRGGGALLRHTASDCANTAEAFMRAEFFVQTLVQFWLVGDDFSPLPVQTCRAFGLSLPYRARAALGERPPSPGLGDAVKLLVMYLNYCSGGAQAGAHMVFEGTTAVKQVPDSLVRYWNTMIQRPLYRFVLRTFLFCPIGAAIKNLSQVFFVWVAYMEPWKICKEQLDEYDVPPPGGRNVQRADEAKERQKSEVVYTLAWQNYVLSNYLFYSSLVVHFLGFAHKFIHSDVASVLRMVSKVLEVLSSSTELLDLLHRADVAYHSRSVASSSCSLDDVLKYVPLIHEQLQDWEHGLSESDADGSFLHEHWNSDLRLFSDDEDGAYNLLQLLLLRAESEIQRLSGDAAQTLQTLDLIKSQMKKVFHHQIEGSQLKFLPKEVLISKHGRGEVFTPKHPSSGKISSVDVKYRGDWMMRPILETEVAWLARMLIRLSAYLNVAFGLDHTDTDNAPPGPTYIKFDRTELCTGGPKDAARMLLVSICTLLVLVGQSILKFMRGHKMKINLRIFASKKFLAAVVLYMVVAVVRNALS